MYQNTNKQLSIHWDAHGCPPFTIGADLSFLTRYKQSGVDFVSMNVGFDLTTQQETLSLIDYFHQWMTEHANEFKIVNNTNDIIACKQTNQLAIAFDIEGCNVLEGNINLLPRLYDLGVKQLVFSYNTPNQAGGGCIGVDHGLTNFGKELVHACNEIGIVIDCSHVGYQTSMDIMQLSSQPVVFSHSNPSALVNHPRNMRDEQIIACAEKGGVVGINGVSIFLGNNDTSSRRIADHIDYVARLVGTEHVGIGLDCLFNAEEIKAIADNHPDTFPTNLGFSDVQIAEPEQFAEFGNLLKQRGYTDRDIDLILGDNFFRIAKKVWK